MEKYDFGTVSGYWLGGPAWFEFVDTEPNPSPDATVYRRALSGGGELWITQAGQVWVDFSGLDRSVTQADLKDPLFDDPKQEVASIVATRRAEFLNAHQLCLIAAIGYREYSEDDWWFQEPRPVSARTLWPAPGWIPTEDPRDGEYSSFRHKRNSAYEVPNAVLEVSVNSFEQLLVVERAPRACHGLLYALDHYGHHRLDQALILAWTTCEVMLDTMWEKYFLGAAARTGHVLNKERRETLNAFTSSTVLENLCLAGLVDQELYKQLSTARKARNKWAHELKRASAKAASDAILSALHLVKVVTGVDIDAPMLHRAPSI